MEQLQKLRDEKRRRDTERLKKTDVFAALGFVPNPGPQSVFLGLLDENLDVLYGGAAGGSKSTSMLMYAMRACVRNPGLQAFWFRRSFPELEHSVIRMLGRYGMGKKLGCRWNASKYELRFPNGSTLTFAHAKNVQEVTALQSAEINLLILDERTTIPPDVVDMLYTRVRSGVAGVPCLGIRSATNPGGIGHTRVKQEYIEATEHGAKEIIDEQGRRRIFIQAKVSDTPQLGPEYARALSGLGEALRRAFLEGDWDVFAGQVFGEWRYDKHVVKPFTLPKTWKRYVGIDWGYANPWAVIWGAQDEDGRVWLYRELYGTQVGESEQARRILEAEAPNEQIVARYADDAMWQTRGDALPIAEIYADNKCYLTEAGKGGRIAGWQRMHTFLAEGPACPHHRALGLETCPMLHAFETCSNFIRTVPSLPYATTGNPEDVDTKSEDHIGDATRYLLINLGGGAQFPILDGPAESDTVVTIGGFAFRQAEDEPAWEDPIKNRGAVVTVTPDQPSDPPPGAVVTVSSSPSEV